MNHNGNYRLDQTRCLYILESYWGDMDAAGTLTDNDKIRLFGIIMSLEVNRENFKTLSFGIKKERTQIVQSLVQPKYLQA